MKFQIDFKLPVHLQQTCHFRFETSKEKNQKKTWRWFFYWEQNFFFRKYWTRFWNGFIYLDDLESTDVVLSCCSTIHWSVVFSWCESMRLSTWKSSIVCVYVWFSLLCPVRSVFQNDLYVFRIKWSRHKYRDVDIVIYARTHEPTLMVPLNSKRYTKSYSSSVTDNQHHVYIDSKTKST